MEKKISLIDGGKLFFAIMVVALHTSAFSENVLLQEFISKHIQALAVPFFFTCSGFFLGKKLVTCVDVVEYRNQIRNYGKKLFGLYIVWAAINFPLRVLETMISGKSIGASVLNSIHSWVVTQPGGGLWYVQAILILLLILMISNKRRFKYCLLFGLHIMYYIPTIFYALAADNVQWAKQSIEAYEQVFITERNFLFYGFFFVLGICIVDFASKIFGGKSYWIFILLCSSFLLDVLVGTVSNKFIVAAIIHMFMRMLVVVLLFVFLYGNVVMPKKISVVLRQMSIVIYFTHYAVKGLVQFLCKNIFTDTIIFLIVMIILLLYCTFILYNKNSKYISKINKILYNL